MKKEWQVVYGKDEEKRKEKRKKGDKEMRGKRRIKPKLHRNCFKEKEKD